MLDYGLEALFFGLFDLVELLEGHGVQVYLSGLCCGCHVILFSCFMVLYMVVLLEVFC